MMNGGLYQLHSADEDAVSWRTNYGSWHAYKKKITCLQLVLADYITLTDSMGLSHKMA